MALDFPTTPANGFVYTSPTGEQWTYETATNSWTSKGLVNTSGGIKYVGTIDIAAVPPTGVTSGALYTVAADGTANAGFGPGVTGALTKGDSVMNTGAGWIKLSHPTSVWLKTGTNLAPTATGDVVSISAGTAALPGLTPVGDPNTGIYSPGADQLGISTNGAERARIDSSGRLLVGTSTARSNFFSGTTTDQIKTQIEGAGTAGDGYGLLSLVANNNSANPRLGSTFVLARSNGTTIGSNTIVDDGKNLGNISFQGADGSSFPESARIAAFVDGTPGAKDMPGRLVFSTTADGASSPTERMGIDSAGRVLVGTGTANTSGAKLQTSDGLTFPATAVASADPNTLDDYEEGTWTPNQGSGLVVVGTFSSAGRYTKVGDLVYVTGRVSGSTSIAITAGSILCSNLIFTQGLDGCGGNCTNYIVNQTAGLSATGGSTNLYATSALTASLSIFFGFTFRV